MRTGGSAEQARARGEAPNLQAGRRRDMLDAASSIRGTRLAIAATVTAAMLALPATAAAVPPRKCTKITVKGKRYAVWTHNVSCTFSRRWAARYLASRRSAPGYRCQKFRGPSSSNIPFFCRERVTPTNREFREYWVTR
jgi:hypothetical protein